MPKLLLWLAYSQDTGNASEVVDRKSESKMAASFTPKLDHIIILVPYSFLSNPPVFFARNFNILHGGTHADGKTANALVVFPSGVYLEFIAFVDDNAENRTNHWWGKKTFGWIDWAITSDNVDDCNIVSKRLIEGRSDLQYDAPSRGGRTKQDGTKIEWQVTFPSAGRERGSVPFWCHDITPRLQRVPNTQDVIKHPTNVTGISRIAIITTEANVEGLVKDYAALLKSDPVDTERSTPATRFVLNQPQADSKPATVEIRGPRNADEATLLHGHPSGVLAEVTIATEEGVSFQPTHVEEIGGARVTFAFAQE